MAIGNALSWYIKGLMSGYRLVIILYQVVYGTFPIWSWVPWLNLFEGERLEEGGGYYAYVNIKETQ